MDSGVKELAAYFQMEYVMSFLMGLSESFNQVGAQLLLLDSLPPIKKVYSLVGQEERQLSVSSQLPSGGADPINSLAFTIQNETLKWSTVLDA